MIFVETSARLNLISFNMTPTSSSAHVQNDRCVQFIRLEGYWNDLGCDDEISFICKKPKELLPRADDSDLPTEPGCDPGWSAYGERVCLYVGMGTCAFSYV